MLSRPAALLLDELSSKLDTGLRDQMRSLVFAEVRRQEFLTVWEPMIAPMQMRRAEI